MSLCTAMKVECTAMKCFINRDAIIQCFFFAVELFNYSWIIQMFMNNSIVQ